MSKFDIAILGGGFSGAAVAIHASKAAPRPLRIAVIEPRTPGPGLAHASRNPDHRLNAPDSIHILHPENAEHFPEWLRRTGYLESDPLALADSGFLFPRRGALGRYLAEQLSQYAASNPSGSTIEHVAQRATRLRQAGDGIEVELDDGGRITARLCVLASGWDSVATPPQLKGLAGHPAWLPDPWDDSRLSSIKPDQPVLLLGAGLTASDVFTTLVRRGHQAPVTCVSRRGLRPASQNPFRSKDSYWARITDPNPPFLRRHGVQSSVLGMLAALRKDFASLDPAAESWHGPFDELRDALGILWPPLDTAEKKLLVRHLKPWYDAHRFRNPPQIEAVIDDGIRNGRLTFVTGRVSGARSNGRGLTVDYIARGAVESKALDVGAVINCTGPNAAPSASPNPLLRTMIADGWIRDNAWGVGVAVDTACRAIGANGRPNDALLVIGPPSNGSLGETTAVPFITRQIVDVIARLKTNRFNLEPATA